MTISYVLIVHVIAERKKMSKKKKKEKVVKVQPVTIPKPILRFSPYAWAKLNFFRDRGDTEIGGSRHQRFQDIYG